MKAYVRDMVLPPAPTPTRVRYVVLEKEEPSLIEDELLTFEESGERQRKKRAYHHRGSGETQAEQRELRRNIRQQRHDKVITMYQQGKKTREIAEELGIPQATARKIWQRYRRREAANGLTAQTSGRL